MEFEKKKKYDTLKIRKNKKELSHEN